MKINCVPLGNAKQDLMEVAALARERKIHVRFIEMMPIGYGKQFTFLGEVRFYRCWKTDLARYSPVGSSWGTVPVIIIPYRDFVERSVLSAPSVIILFRLQPHPADIPGIFKSLSAV